MPKSTGYRGNPNIKRVGVNINWTQEQLSEYIRCSEDCGYFIENYMKIISLDDGLINFKMRTYQKKIIKTIIKNDSTIITAARQSGKSAIVCGYVLWYVLFHSQKTVAILANKEKTALEIMGKVRIAYQYLPSWLQVGIVEWNKGSIELENDSRIVATASASDAIRGYAISCLILDEAAFIANFDLFFASVYPTISSGKTTKLVLISTPNGLNHYYKIWDNAVKKQNEYAPVLVTWRDVPGRDERWKQKTLSALNFDQEKFNAEYECEFLGSSGTLISGWKLKQLISGIRDDIGNNTEDKHYKIYEQPLKARWEQEVLYHDNLLVHDKMVEKPPHEYMIMADVARGRGLDYSAFSVIDITTMPYKQVATFRDNLITPADYAEIILALAKYYNDAYVLCEINDIGEQVGTILLDDNGYENVICSQNSGKRGKELVFGGKKIDKGIRTTTLVKNSGCLILKLLIEQGQLEIYDKDTVDECTTFSKNKKTYQAEAGKHDDLMMGLVLFAWMTDQDFFKQLTDINTMSLMREKTHNQMRDELRCVGIYHDQIAEERIPNDMIYQGVNLNIPWNPFSIGKIFPEEESLWQNAINF